MNPFEMVVIIVFLSMTTGTIHKYLDYRMRMAGQQVRGLDESVRRAIDDLRAQVAALKQHEAEAVLSFDSTLQTLDARVKHLERRALGEAAPEHAPLGGAASSVEEPARLTAKGA